MVNKKSKKVIVALLATATVSCTGAFGLTGCATGEHEHSWKTDYSYSSDGHWIEASCHEGVKKGEVEQHVYDNDGDATCSVCDYVRPMITGLSVTNRSAIENWRGKEDKTVEILLEGDYDVATAFAAGLIKVSSSDNDVIIVKNGNVLHAVTGGSCKVTVTAGTHKVEMNVEVVVPEIILSGNVVNSHADGVAVALPDFTVKGYNGDAITDVSKITVTDEDDKDAVIQIRYDEEDGCFKGTIATALYTGSAHSIVISADDGETEEPLTAEITGNFYRQICSYVSSGYTRTNGWVWDTGKQVSTIKNTGNFTSRFNVALSEKYYAQASYKFSDIEQIRYLGLMHSVGEFGDGAKWMWTAVGKTGENEYTFYADDQPNNGWSFGEDTAKFKVKIPASAITNDVCLIQVARSGSDYHCFVNGVYLGVFTSTAYGAGVAAAPGFYTHGGGSDIAIQVTNVDFYSGERVDEFISENVPEITSVEVSNKTDLAAWRGDEDIDVELAVTGGCTAEEAVSYGLVKIVSSDSSIVSVTGNVLHRVNEGECTLTVTANGVSTAIELAVRFVGINLSSDTINGHADGSGIAIPSFYVKNDAGQYVSEGVTLTDISDPDAEINLNYNADNNSWGGTIGSSLYTGEAHKLKITYTDVNEEEYSAEITANLYRPVVSWTSGKVTRENTYTYDIYDQTLGLKSADNAASHFAMAGSEKFYAQINYKLADIDRINKYAGLIFSDATQNVGTAKWMWAVVKKVDTGYRFFAFEYDSTLWSFDENIYYDVKVDIPEDYFDDGNCLLQCVREGGTYSYYINNRYLTSFRPKYYGDGVPAIPGAYMHSGGYSGLVTANKIDYFSDDKVDEYLNSHLNVKFENNVINGTLGLATNLGMTVSCGDSEVEYTVQDLDDEDAVIDVSAGTILTNKDTGAYHTLLISIKDPTSGKFSVVRKVLAFGNVLAHYDFSTEENKWLSGNYTVSDGKANISSGLTLGNEIISVIRDCRGSVSVAFDFDESVITASTALINFKGLHNGETDSFVNYQNKLWINSPFTGVDWTNSNGTSKFVFTYDGLSRIATAYIKDASGNLYKVSGKDSTLLGTVNYICIGQALKNGAAGRAHYNGTIDNLTVYGAVLTEDEVKAL